MRSRELASPSALLALPCLLILLVFLPLAVPLAAGAEEPLGRRFGRHLLESPRLVGDPGGARSRLEQLGLMFQLFFNTTLGAKLRGGANPDDVARNSGSYDFFTLVDVEEAAGWPGLGILLHVKGSYNRNINPDVGALADPIDDADFDEPIYLAELFLNQQLFDDRLDVRFGYLDQQTILDRNAFANSEDIEFMNTALDNNPIVPLKIGLGAALLIRPLDWLTITLATNDADNTPRDPTLDNAFDGIEGWMGYLELGVLIELESARGGLPGRYRIGGFWDATERLLFDADAPQPEASRGHSGAYLSFDQLVYRERPGSLEGLGLFARWGVADPKVNAIDLFWSLGLQYRGPIPGRPLDALGLGYYQGRGSRRYRDAIDSDFRGEAGVELYYRWQALPWLALSPDFQYIVDPGGRRSAPDAVVLALRGRIQF